MRLYYYERTNNYRGVMRDDYILPGVPYSMVNLEKSSGASIGGVVGGRVISWDDPWPKESSIFSFIEKV